MKKFLLVAASLFLIIILFGCSAQESIVQSATQTTSSQAEAIEQILADNAIEVKSITKVDITAESEGDPADDLSAALAQVYEPYDVESTDGKTYRITLKAEDKTLFSIVDNETSEFIYGGIGGLWDNLE